MKLRRAFWIAGILCMGLLGNHLAQAGWQWYSGKVEYSTITNCPSIIFGNPYPESGAAAYVSFIADPDAQLPKVNDLYYLSVVIWGLGNACAGQRAGIEIQLPPSTTIDPTWPVECYNKYTPPGTYENCTSALAPSARGSNVYRLNAPGQEAYAYTWPLPQGGWHEIQIPVKSSTPLTAAELRAYVQMFDGNSNPLLQPTQGVFVFSGTSGGPGTLMIESKTVDESAGTVTLRVSRFGGSSGVVGVSYATANDTAIAGSDYTTQSGTLSWNSGDTTSKAITLSILNDGMPENTENLVVNLSNPTGGATLGAAKGTVTITDGDTAPAGVLGFSLTTAAAYEGTTVELSVNRIFGTTGGVSVSYSMDTGTATKPDFEFASGTLNWDAGDSSTKKISILITPDGEPEGDETFSVNLSKPTNGALLDPSRQSAGVTIKDTDPDAPGVLQFLAMSSTHQEGDTTSTPLLVTVARVGGSKGKVSVDINGVEGSATVTDGDFTAERWRLTWLDGEITPQTYTQATIKPDYRVEGNETFALQLSNPLGGADLGEITTHTVNIVDDDEYSYLQFSTGQVSVKENSGAVTLTVTRTGSTEGAASIEYLSQNVTATAGLDYTATAGTLSWLPGDGSSRDIQVPILRDREIEGDENFHVTLRNPEGGILGIIDTENIIIQDAGKGGLPAGVLMMLLE